MKSFLLTNSTSQNVVAAGGVIPLGSAVHGYGCKVKLNGSAINLTQRGYYNVNVSVSAASTADDVASIGLYSNGVAIAGATATASPAAAGDYVNLVFNWVIRKSCCADPTALTVVSSAAATVTNIIVEVEEL